MSAAAVTLPPRPPTELSPEAIKRRLRLAILFAARLQLFVSSALVWLIFIFSAVPNGIPPLVPTVVLSAWIVTTTLVLSYLAVRGDLRFLTGPLPGRVALFTTTLTVLLATFLIRDLVGDFYLIYFFPVAVATIYYGLRGGIPTSLLCGASYALLLFGLNGSALNPALFSLIAGRVVFLFALAATIGVSAEGHLALTRELRNAYLDLQTTARNLESIQNNLARRVEEAATLDRIAREFTATLDAQRVLRLVLEQVESTMGAEASTLMTLDTQTSELVFQIPMGSKADQLQGYRLPVGQGVAGWVAQHARPLRVDDAEHDARYSQSVDQASGFHTRSILCVPMQLQERVTGVIEVMNKKVGCFNDDDERLLTSVAQWAAIAIENARLYQDLARSMDELKKAQEQLVRAERLRALGEMAGGVAHDFNNLLTIILAESQLLSTQPHAEREQRSLERIEKAASDAAQAVRRIQEYSRVRRDTPQQVVEINELLQEIVEITRPRWEPLARVETQLQPAGAVAGNPAELREVLTNLIFNAVDARVPGHDCRIVIRSERENADWANISVEDNGSGIPPEVRTHIFDPYFTTKSHGTGLGLSVAYGIIARHGGEIHVASPLHFENGNGSAAGGTRFDIRLPLTNRTAEKRGEMDKPMQSTEFARILFVDDDANILEAASSLLSARGHQVTTARTTAEAEAQISSGQFDVMMTDLTMPQKSGWDLARRAKELWPRKPVVLVTGWGLQLDAKQLSSGVVDRVLTKPFTMEELTRALDGLAVATKQR